jgi:hypothetical protein
LSASGKAQRTAFVVDGYFPAGGTYMAYHVGRIVHRHFGYECRVVLLGGKSRDQRFEYPSRFETVGLGRLEHQLKPEDLLIVTPSLAHHTIDLQAPCRKLMYIQGFNTYKVLDGFVDHYVCASRFVQSYVQLVYGITPPVIPPFIRTDLATGGIPWRERPAKKVLMQSKVFGPQLIRRFKEKMRLNHPEVAYDLVPLELVSHRDAFQAFKSHRYVLSLSACEGFGLVPLEAMACGCAVAAFEAGGGSEYMRAGLNCESVGYPDLDALADGLAALISDDERAERIAAQAAVDAQAFDYRTFEHRWIDHLSERLA